MPRPFRHPRASALVLLLGLRLPLAASGAPGRPPAAPTAAPGPAALPAPTPAPDHTPPLPPDLNPGRGQPGPRTEAATPSPLQDQLDGLQKQVDRLQEQSQTFEWLQTPRSLLQFLALAGLPVAILALALTILQGQRQRRELRGLRRRLEDLRQELNALAAPATAGRVQPPTPLPPLPSQLPEILRQPLQPPAPVPAPAAAVVEPPPAPVLGIDDWINALNTGHRESLRQAAASQLNITKYSEDAIQMGRSDATCLEDVPGGGSYLRVTCGDTHWLLPTERTLASFRSHPSKKGVFKGLFAYQPVASGEPQVQEACRLEPAGAGWRVLSPGVIRVAD